MADISISKSRGKKYLGGASPMVPAFIVGDDPIPLNPPGSGGGGSFFGVGAGLSLDDTQKVQFGKIEVTDPSVVYVDLKEYPSASPDFNNLIITSDWDSYWNASTNFYSSISVQKNRIRKDVFADLSNSTLDIEAESTYSNTTLSSTYSSNIASVFAGNTTTQQTLSLYKSNELGSQLLSFEPVQNKIVIDDNINSKGLEYLGDYEANFTVRSLVTKQYVDSAISGAGHLPVTIGSPANGLSISGTQVLSIGLASSIAIGALSSTDWSTFNGKLNLTSLLTGYVVGANTALAATDTILGAFQKVQGQINARVSGTIASGQVAFGIGVNTIGGDADFIWDSVNNRLRVNTTDTTANLAVGGSLNITDGVTTFRIVNASSEVLMGSTTLVPLVFRINNFERWRITSTGILQSNLAQTIQSSSGNLTIATASANGNIVFTPHGTGVVTVKTSEVGANLNVGTSLNISDGTVVLRAIMSSSTAIFGTVGAHPLILRTNSTERSRILSTGEIGIGTTTPTNTLDVNGTARIRTISNGTGDFLTKSATGVITSRTAAEVVSDLALSTNYVTIATAQTITGAKIFNNSLLVQEADNPILRLKTANNTQAVLNFRNIYNEDQAGLQFDAGAGKISLLTRTANTNIEIFPHGTGKIKIPQLPFLALADSNSVLVRDSLDNLSRSASGSFTPTLSGSGLSFTYSLQEGAAYRMGNCIFLRMRIVFSATGTAGAGGLVISGLPVSGIVSRVQRLPVLQFVNSGYTSAEVALLSFEVNGNVTNGTIVSINSSSFAPLTTYTSCGIVIQGVFFTGSL